MNRTVVALIWQRFLPYHVARIRHAQKVLDGRGVQLVPIEVCKKDEIYRNVVPETDLEGAICCFEERGYSSLSAMEVSRRIESMLHELKPNVIFAPAPAFPEGVGAIRYRNRSTARILIMDDIWDGSAKMGRHFTCFILAVVSWSSALCGPSPTTTSSQASSTESFRRYKR